MWNLTNFEVLSSSSTNNYKWVQLNLSSNSYFFIQELPVLHTVLHNINKWHHDLKQEYKYYTQMSMEAT